MSEIKPGDFVKIAGQDTVAEVLSIKGNDLEVAMGIMKMKVKKNKVTLTQTPQYEAYKEESMYSSSQNAGIDTKDKLMRFQFELDVRGKMKEELMVELPGWTDDAVLLGIPEARILHGRGNGILKDAVRSFLRKYKEVESTTDAPMGNGGDGVTIVKFRV